MLTGDPLPHIYIPPTLSDTVVFMRRRLDWQVSNLSNNSDSSGNGDAQNRPRRTSLPEAPPPSLMPARLHIQRSAPESVMSRSVYPFEVDDVVMVERRDAAAWCGMVKWIGELPETLGEPVAGIEMVRRNDSIPLLTILHRKMRYLAVEMGVRMVRDTSTVPMDMDSFYLFECSKRTTDLITPIVYH